MMIIVSFPTARGLLSSDIVPWYEFCKTNQNCKDIPYLNEENYNKNIETVKELKEEAESLEMDLRSLVMAWILFKGEEFFIENETSDFMTLKKI